ncbi:MAG: hypothetical protein HDS18_04740 [Bacteroides sp.]|nr:hypothetical protein [Bacteroides sp.]MBD5304043.1 hypothetical protein [Bacteroides sp.]
MKNLFLLSTILLGASAFSANAQDVMFDFSKTADLGQFGYAPLSLAELQTSTFLNEANGKTVDRLQFSSPNYLLIMNDETITKDGVGITVTNPAKGSSYPRYFFGSITKKVIENPTAADFYCDLRWYKNQEIEINAPEGKKIEKVVMDATCGDYPVRANGDTYVQGEVGKQTFNDAQTLNTWDADGEVVTKLTFAASSDAPTQMAYSIAVTLADLNGDSGVEVISFDTNAPAEYFDLTGAKRNADNLAPGVYVMRQGSKASKIIVK